MLIERKDGILLSFSADCCERVVLKSVGGDISLSLGEMLLLRRERLKAGEIEAYVNKKGTLIKAERNKVCLKNTGNS